MNTTVTTEINETQQLLRQTVIGTSVTLVLIVGLISLANFIV
jgi:hypothetical protein